MCILNSSVSWEITPLYFFSLNNIYFTEKDSIKVKIFETFECYAQVKICQIPYADLKQQVDSSSNFVSLLSFMKENSSSVLFLAQTKYTFFKRSTLKWKFLRISSAWVKIRQILQVNFEMASYFLFKFCVILHGHDR